MESNQPIRILVARPDRLGDVILSTPVISALHKKFPHAKITLLVKESIAPLMTIEGVSEVWTYSPDGEHKGLRGLLKLQKKIRLGGFRVAVVLQTELKLALAVFLAGVRVRLGPFSKIHSYLLFNKGLRQRRSLVEMHEADYNLQLLSKIGIHFSSREFETQVFVSDLAKSTAKSWLISQGIDLAKRFVVVHPGMGGSALNWPESHYGDLVLGLLKDGVQVVMTTGPLEKDLAARMKERVKADPHGGLNFRAFDGSASTTEGLGALFSFASVVIAPSTGPLHLAVALGKRVVTFYPPIRVQSAIRWGAYLKDDSKASVFVPDVFCGQDFHCRGEACHYFPCMKGLPVADALEQVKTQLDRATP